jgi:hypothetical protein
LIGPDAITAYVPLFFGGGIEARLTWSILIAFSACGSLLAVIYTCARGLLRNPSVYFTHLTKFQIVKQVIGMSNVIPWSRLWKSTSHSRSKRPTPKGGLILHAIFSVILITATSGMYNISEAISFPGNVQAYASGWVGGTFAAKLFYCLSLSTQLTLRRPQYSSVSVSVTFSITQSLPQLYEGGIRVANPSSSEPGSANSSSAPFISASTSTL